MRACRKNIVKIQRKTPVLEKREGEASKEPLGSRGD